MRPRTAGFQVFNVRTGQISVPRGEVRDVGRDMEKEEIVFVLGFICLFLIDLETGRFNY